MLFCHVLPLLYTHTHTIPIAPSPPRMLTNVTMIGDPTGIIIELNWLPPLHPNGAIHYEIEYEPAMTPGDRVNAGSSSSPYFNLTLPNEFMVYNVSVIASNTQGQASDSITIQTEKIKGMYVYMFAQNLVSILEKEV